MSRFSRPLLMALFALLVALSTAQAQTPSDKADLPPAHARCHQMCAEYFKTDDAKRTECEAGCSTAAGCADACATRFADDQEKRERCNARCARKGKP